MNVTLTLNEINVEQANKILALVKNADGKPAVQTEPEIDGGVPLYDGQPVEKTPTENKYDYAVEDVRKAMAGLAKRKGKDTAKDLLTKFGAAKVTELKPEQFTEVMKAVEEVV